MPPSPPIHAAAELATTVEEEDTNLASAVAETNMPACSTFATAAAVSIIAFFSVPAPILIGVIALASS